MTLVKIVHLLALVFGSAASLGNLYLNFAMQKSDLTAPGYTNRLRGYFRYSALVAIIALWVSGLILLVFNYGGWVPGIAFAAKLGFVVVLTAVVLFVNYMAPGWARRGGPPAYVSKLHWISATCLLSSVILAALAFG